MDTSAVKPNPLILVAEDEREIRELIVFTLEIADFRVVAVPNGQEAVKKAVEISPDLILMDVRMPKMNGFELCGEIRKIDDKVKITFMTAFDIKKDDLKIAVPSLKGEEPLIIRKPIPIDDFVIKVKEELE